jgi:hypothetical protein
MHRFVTSSIFFVATSLIACSGGHSTSAPGNSEGALANGDKGGDPDPGKGGDPNPGGGKGGGCGGGGDACFTQAIDTCLDYGQLKQLVADKCGVPGLTITQIDFGPSCGDNKAAGVKYTCCAAPPPQKCQDFPIPPEICKDPVAVKEYFAKVCAGGSGSLTSDDPCSPKAAIECCEAPPPPPPPKCQDFPIPPDVCKDPAALKDYAAKVCAGGALNFILPDGDPCGPKSAVECCAGDPTPPPPQK